MDGGDLFDENTSVWAAARPERPPRAAPRGTVDVDVAIVGGGFTGVSTAWQLSQRFPDKGIALLEAGLLGQGASGRNGGMMLTSRHGFAGDDLTHARAFYEATVEGIETIGEMLEAAKATGCWRRQGSMDVFTDEAGADAAREECERLQAAGVPLEFLDGAEVRRRLDLQGVHGAQFDPNSGQLDGVGLLEAMLPLLEERGVAVHEGTRVTVLATNAYVGHLGYFRRGVVPLHSHVLGSRARSPEEWAALGWRETLGFADDAGRVSYGALTPRGELVYGGGSNQSYSYLYGGRTAFRGDRTPHLAAIRSKLHAYMPQLEGLDMPFAWSGPIGLTLDRIPTMGVRGSHRNVYYAVGFSGHGVTLANLAGKVLTDLYAGAPERWRGLPFFERRPYFVPPEPFTWVGYHLFTRATGRSPRRRLRPAEAVR
jgi:glycine/D-amino acid oxidase-like deaminating enzyme